MAIGAGDLGTVGPLGKLKSEAQCCLPVRTQGTAGLGVWSEPQTGGARGTLVSGEGLRQEQETISSPETTPIWFRDGPGQLGDHHQALWIRFLSLSSAVDFLSRRRGRR